MKNISCDPTIPFLGVFQEKQKYISIQWCILSCHNSFIHSSQNLKKIQCPSTVEWIIKMWHLLNKMLLSSEKEQTVDTWWLIPLISDLLGSYTELCQNWVLSFLWENPINNFILSMSLNEQNSEKWFQFSGHNLQPHI